VTHVLIDKNDVARLGEFFAENRRRLAANQKLFELVGSDWVCGRCASRRF
jgi:hypothetical protein